MKSDVLKSIAQKAKRRLVGKDEQSVAKIKIISNEDAEFKDKVEFLLSQEDVIINPVHYLMDDKILKNLNEQAKERYLLSTLDKFSQFRNQIEKTDSRFCL